MSEAALILRPDEVAPVRQQAMTPADMLSMAVDRNASVEVMTKLMDLRDRWEAGLARKAFEAAVANAKAEIPAIAKNREGHNKTRYADFAAYAAVVDPIIARHGLSYRFRTEQTDRISVTCILSHRDGHSEENKLSGPADKTGSKNEIQAIGSTLTYLQRYTLVQALGLAASQDDDGRSAQGQPEEQFITEEQVMELREYLESVGIDESQFKGLIKVSDLSGIYAAKFQAAKDLIRQKANRRG